VPEVAGDFDAGKHQRARRESVTFDRFGDLPMMRDGVVVGYRHKV
jgi:hypothetical protein